MDYQFHEFSCGRPGSTARSFEYYLPDPLRYTWFQCVNYIEEKKTGPFQPVKTIVRPRTKEKEKFLQDLQTFIEKYPEDLALCEQKQLFDKIYAFFEEHAVRSRKTRTLSNQKDDQEDDDN